ncbi:Uncharacterised protein [Alysiella crassa]|uniref:Uncharacterized protein n=1 Tax=Alysiella crassa TaxID=153491 RepID=A0A376BVC6_9NEIS|nr:Uncharacterised protein [Alysiella crassa]
MNKKTREIMKFRVFFIFRLPELEPVFVRLMA